MLVRIYPKSVCLSTIVLPFVDGLISGSVLLARPLVNTYETTSDKTTSVSYIHTRM